MIRDILRKPGELYRREVALSDYRKLMSDPHRYSFAQRAQVYRAVAEHAAATPAAREQFLSWAAFAEKQSARYDGNDGDGDDAAG